MVGLCLSLLVWLYILRWLIEDFFFFNLGLFRKGFVCDEFSKETANMATPQSGRVFIVNKREYPEACERIQSREREADWTWPGLSARQGRRAEAELCITRVMREQAMGKETRERLAGISRVRVLEWGLCTVLVNRKCVILEVSMGLNMQPPVPSARPKENDSCLMVLVAQFLRKSGFYWITKHPPVVQASCWAGNRWSLDQVSGLGLLDFTFLP